MIKIINEETGKEAFTIKDNGDIVVDGTVKVTEEKDVKEALEKANEKEE